MQLANVICMLTGRVKQVSTMMMDCYIYTGSTAITLLLHTPSTRIPGQPPIVQLARTRMYSIRRWN
jgi:hypothetical protein